MSRRPGRRHGVLMEKSQPSLGSREQGVWAELWFPRDPTEPSWPAAGGARPEGGVSMCVRGVSMCVRAGARARAHRRQAPRQAKCADVGGAADGAAGRGMLTL